MMNEGIKTMIKNEQEAYITLENDTYYFNGFEAMPIKCQCGGNIALYTEGWNCYLFNDEDTKSFDIHIDGEDNNREYICQDCKKEFNELTPDIETGIWE